ncbi:MerR family transcriptional regulator [Saccharopolyspora cebuensis]|uniref:MerR family transcriptional regulator n=1 Tax=Saccharopolyspora cebuensis TaxID=418759 RepID=A0ABV4CKK9_9PSEU
MNVTDDHLFPIGDAARRTGLAVSAIRFYADEGIVEPTEVTAAGHRLYDVRAIARLELIRTLRDLGTGLEQVRRLLSGESALRYLLAEHLDLVERQGAELRTKRAVLRALVRHDDPGERLLLMRGLVTMPDAERERLLDEFWDEVSAGLPAGSAERLRGVRPRLPDDPTAEQLQAWIELAELVQDPEFRAAVRSYLHDTYATGPGLLMGAEPVQDFIASSGQDLMSRIIAAHRSGLAPDAAHARDLAARLVRQTAEATGATVDAELWDRMATGFPVIAEMHHEALHDPEYEATHGRYLSLVATISGTPEAEPGGDPADPRGEDLAGLGTWLSEALLASKPTS